MMKILYQLSTHWDREWYRPFQEFRYYLTEMTDRLIDALEKNEISVFSFDGQTIVIDDYLEVRSENADRLKSLIKNGKIKIGPWYVMPDELTVSGESLVENFLVGHNTADKYGTSAWKFGYINDVFGHIAQFPQILNGFGINGVYLGRGAGRERQFIWQAPDNSECFVFNYVYANFKRAFDESKDKKKFLTDFIKENDAPILIINYTDDHAGIDSNTVEFEKLLKAMPYEVVEGLEKYSSEVSQYYDTLPRKNGELIETARTGNDFRAVTHSLSSYYPLKQKNDFCEKLVYNVLAPMIVMGEFYGISGKRAFFDIARKYLLKNQPHDSICGCSIDEVHDNMPYRYNQTAEIANVVKDDFLSKLYPDNASDNSEYFLYVYNFGITAQKGVITVDIDFPKGWETTFYTNALCRAENMFKIIDEYGNNVEYQLLHTDAHSETYDRQSIIPVFRHTIAMNTVLKPFGASKFKLVPNDNLNVEPAHCPIGILRAENKYLVLEITEIGSISITNKATGKVYSGLNTYVEDSDAGNGWFYESAAPDAQSVISSGGSVEVLNQGTLLNRFRITSHISVPTCGDRNSFSRDTSYTDLRILTTITLRADDKKVEFETEVDNTAEDHRLRVLFPTGIWGDSYTASQAFCFIERQRGVTKAGLNSREPESYEKNTSGIVGVRDNENCLFFIGKNGFHEAGVYPDGTISVTMFRGFGQSFHQPKTVSAQLKGKLCFTYALSVSDKGLFDEQLRLSDKPYTKLCRNSENPSDSLLFLDNNDIALSVIKPAENKNGWIVRLFNPLQKAASAKLYVNMNVKNVYEVTLEEQIKSRLNFNDKYVNIEFEPYKIKTYYLEI